MHDNHRYQLKLASVFLSAALALGLAGCADVSKENQMDYKTIGINALGEDRYEDAVDAFQRALEQSYGIVGVDEIDIAYYKAIAQLASGDTTGARTTYDALLAYDSTLSEAYFLRGNLSLNEDDLESAMSDYENALKWDSGNLELYVVISENLTNTGHPEEGASFLQKATELPGNSPEAHALRGRAFALLKQYDQATKELDQAIQGGSAKAKLYKGELLTETGDTAGATELFQSYLADSGEDAGALNALGCASMAAGDYPSALAYFEQALSCATESGVDPQEILRNRILAFEYNGRFPEAKAAMAEYAESYPMDPDFEKEYTFLSTR